MRYNGESGRETEKRGGNGDFDPIIFTFYGNKGVGKSVAGLMAVPGSKLVFQFDTKTRRAKKNLERAGVLQDEVEIKDYRRAFVVQPSGRLSGAVASVEQMIRDIEESNVDWIMIDNHQKFAELCEMAMREQKGKTAWGGVELNLWKLRRKIMFDVFEAMRNNARYGCIFTAYVKKDEIYKDGVLISSKDIPAYVDIVMEETDIVARVITEEDKDGKIFHRLHVESSKLDMIAETGETLNISRYNFKEMRERIGRYIDEELG